MSNRDIEGKTVLVTGAFGGIGQALVQALLEAGAAQIIAASRSPQPSNDRRIVTATLDVRDQASVAALAKTHPVDILINNSGVNANTGPLAVNATEDARNEMDANYFGLLNMCWAFAPPMVARGNGVIVNILSTGALKVLPRMTSYCASKAAAWSLTQGLRAELEGKGIDVIAMLPGATDTRLTAHLTIPKLSPKTVADATIAAIRDGVLERTVTLTS
ncbi:MAG: short-chain dehydrogenase [Hyphomicrobiales bacterium]|nr:short-chain dehydrogenase [Hyphomicrobiales bacterium]